ncbi:MAG: DUF1566 domain-containing protein [Pleomorphochaeta sp.]
MKKTNHIILKGIILLLSTVTILIGCNLSSSSINTSYTTPTISFVVTDTMQTSFYDNEGTIIDAPEKGELYYGQDAQYEGVVPSYTDNGDGTVTDNNTGFMWQQTPPTNKMTYDEAVEYVEDLEIGGYADWRLPTIKESFSIAMLAGELDASDTSNSQPYIDTDYFDFFYDEAKPYTGSYWTSTVCKMPAENDYEEMEKNYGFNWADGHLKSYADGYNIDGSESDYSIPAGVRAVRGEENVYGVNDFQDNEDYTISDNATGLMWTQVDSGYLNDDGSFRNSTDDNFGLGRDWVDTLSWVEDMNDISLFGYNDWRLPNIKELQSIVEYEKTELPATDPDFFTLSRPNCYVYSSTTCGDFTEMADYIAFGRGYGIDLDEDTSSDTATIEDFVDVHGPGCMRADYKDTTYEVTQVPKLSRDFWADLYDETYPYSYDESDTTTEFDLSNSENAADYIVIYNYALLVRDIN